MMRKLPTQCRFILMSSLALMFSLSLGSPGCTSQGGVSSTPADLAGVPAADLAVDGGSAADLSVQKTLLWLKQLPSSKSPDLVQLLAVDKAGNVFVACKFAGEVDFGDGPRTSKGQYELAIVKLTAAGDMVWVRQFGNGEITFLTRMVIDPSGNVIVAGSFNLPLDFGAGPVVSHGSYDYFVAKYSNDGALLWAKAVGSAGLEEAWCGLAVDDGGNIYFAAPFNMGARTGTIDLGGGPLTSAGYADGFVVKFDPGGAHVFSRLVGGPNIDYIMGLALDKSGDIVISGRLGGKVNLGGGNMDPGSETIEWAFVARLDKTGKYKWAVGYYSDGSYIDNVAIDDTGAITVSGSFARLLQTKTASLSPPGDRAYGFLLQLDASGTERWARSIAAGSHEDYQSVLLIDGSRILVGGQFMGTGDFGLGPRTAAGRFDGYLMAYSLAGVPQWLRQVGKSDDNRVNAIARSADAIYAGGEFATTVDFGGGMLTSKGYTDGFLMKLAKNSPQTP